METEEEEINSLTALIAQETAAAHDALRLELDNFDELSIFDEENEEDDEPNLDSTHYKTSESTPPPIGIRNEEKVEDSLKHLRSHLSAEEVDLIVQCPPDDNGGVTLKRCMILNRSKRIELLQTYQYYSNLMWRIVSDEKKETVPCCREGFNQCILNKVAAPYFKVDRGFSHAPNADVLQTRANGELSVYFVTSGRRRWTLENQTNLRGAIRLNNYVNKKAKLERDLKYLNSKLVRCQDEEERYNYIDQIKNFEEDLRANQQNYEHHFPPLDSDEFIDWEDISIKDLQGKFSAATCKAMWRLYLHPDINNADWKVSEIERVHEIVTSHNYQRWEQIAQELGGNRSPYLLCVHFFNALVDRYDRNTFTPEESARLKAIIDKYLLVMGQRRVNTMQTSFSYTYIPWAKVAREFGTTRSRPQLYMHYMYRLRDRDNRIMGNFTASEDVQILYMIAKYGENFPLIAEHMKRSVVQLRQHYIVYLKPLHSAQFRNWTLEDDEKLTAMVKLFGNRFAMISRELDRTVGAVRSRYKVIRRYTDTGMDLKDIPKRKRAHQQVVKRVQSKILADALADANEPFDIDHIRNTFNEKPVRLAGVTSKLGRPPLKYDVVDQQLVTYFKMTACIGRTYKLRQISEESLNRCASSIRNIFSLLKVNSLDIPTTEELNTHGLSFDEIDRQLLTLLSDELRNKKQDNENDNIYLPPNISNIFALKGLVMGTKSSADGHIKIAGLRKLFKNDLADLTEDTQRAVSNDRNIFVERFNNILMWPSILSLQSIELTEEDKVVPTPKRTPIKKPKGRPKKDRSKINMMVEARMKRRAEMKINSETIVDSHNINNDSSDSDDHVPDASQDSIHGTVQSNIAGASQCNTPGTSVDDNLVTSQDKLTGTSQSNITGTSQSDIPSTSQNNISETLLVEKPHLKIAVEQKVILNKKAATSVEEVNELLQAGKSMGPTNTLVKIDKRTMQKMQQERQIQQVRKKMKVDRAYTYSRITRSVVSSGDLGKLCMEERSELMDVESCISKAVSSIKATATYRRAEGKSSKSMNELCKEISDMESDISKLDDFLNKN